VDKNFAGGIMTTKKWVNRFAPLFKPNSNMNEVPLTLRTKIMDLFERTIVEPTGEKKGSYEEVRYATDVKVITGWIHEGDLENYIENYPRDCVVIYNQTPLPNDFEQYFIFKGVKQVNACGELCVAYILGISLQELLENWQAKRPSLWNRIFSGGRARGTSSGELGEMIDIYARKNQQLTTALYESHINRSRYTIKGLQRLLETGSVIVSVSIDGGSGLLRGSGVLHWVAVTKITPERNGLGFVEVYNPAMNRIECYSWLEFINSARQPYGVYVPNVSP
jgi:hypothetical protein